ncbi:hypothetical protein, partial [Acinetobacter baumannii]|uniref:hypothetical protein n=1 Tax=Acinetobacter baumannii TaxID=470 RepID=UPI003F6625AC
MRRAPEQRPSPWSSLPGFRLLATGATPFLVSADGATALVTVAGGPRHFTLGDAEGHVAVEASTEGTLLTVVIDGTAIA